MTLASIQQTIARIGFYTQEKDIPLINKQGGKYHWLFDLRRVFMETSTLQAIAQEFWGRYASRGPFQLAGMETAAIPLLTALMLTAPDDRGPVNGLIIRKNRKTSGLCRAVEGEILNLPIILVDDTINSGNSAEKACAMLSLEGHEVRDMFVVIDFLSQKGRHWRRANGVSIQTLFTLKDFGLQISSTRTAAMQSYRELWRTTTPGGIAYHIVPKSAPLLVENKIYRGCDAAKMQAFSAETGGLIWEYEATGAASSRKGIWSSPAWHDGKLYFGAYNGTLYCLDATTGEEIWTRPEGEWVGASPLIVDRHNLVYFGIEYARPWAQGSLGAYDMDTGEKIWEHQVEKLQHGSPGYWRGGDLVIWGSADHEMLGLDARTGRIVWRFPTRRSVKYAPAIDEERRLTAFASFDKSIYILDVATGEKRGEWVTGEICYTTPLFVGNKLFCGSGDRELYIIDVDHMVLIRRIPLHARIYASPRVVDGRVIVATNGGRVVEIDAATLEIRGMLQLPDAVTNAVVVSDDQRRIIVSTYMNHLYAFERTVSKEHLMSLAEKTVTAEVDVDDFPVIQTSRSSNLQNFELVRTDTDVSHMLDEIKAHSEMWIANNERQDDTLARKKMEHIFLRSASFVNLNNKKPEDIHESEPTPVAVHYPSVMQWIDIFARQEDKRVARVVLTRLGPDARTCLHTDNGAYYQARDRYHLVLSSTTGSRMMCGDEEVVMQEGELWWLDNRQCHSVTNTSDKDQIHLVFDLEYPE